MEAAMFSTLMDIHEATNVMDDVHLGPLLGSGSFGHVYLGYHTNRGKVAVKVVQIENCGKLKEFEMEVRAGLDIKHKNVTALHEWRVVQTKYYYSSSPPSLDGASPMVGSPFRQTTQSPVNSPDTMYQRVQSMKHRLYSSSSSTGFSRMSSSTSLNNYISERQDECHCKICSDDWTELWLIQELCCLGTLSKAIMDGCFAKVPLEHRFDFVVKIALDIAQGIHALHDKGVIHADLSSSNVMLACEKEGHEDMCLKPWVLDLEQKQEQTSLTHLSHIPMAKLIDFGRSKSTQKVTPHTDSLSTLAYMSPELMTHGTMSPAADCYSFGVLLWELWMNALAWDGLLAAQIIIQRSKGTVLDVPTDAPPELQDLMRDCLADDRHSRPLIGEVIRRLQSMRH